MKKFFTTIVFLTSFLFSIGSSFALTINSFNDSNQISDWAKPAIDKFTKDGVIQGYNDGSFKPHREISRAEFAKILLKFSISESEFIDLKTKEKDSYYNNPDRFKEYLDKFGDIENAWYVPYLSKAVEKGILKGDGSTNTIRPNDKVSKAEGIVMIERIFNLQNIQCLSSERYNNIEYSKNNEWYYDIVQHSKCLETIIEIDSSEKNNFDPFKKITREEAVSLMYNFYLVQQSDLVNECKNEYALLRKKDNSLPNVRIVDNRSISLSNFCNNSECKNFDIGGNYWSNINISQSDRDLLCWIKVDSKNQANEIRSDIFDLKKVVVSESEKAQEDRDKKHEEVLEKLEFCPNQTINPPKCDKCRSDQHLDNEKICIPNREEQPIRNGAKERFWDVNYRRWGEYKIQCYSGFELQDNECKEKTIAYEWQLDSWSTCSEDCGGGIQVANFICKSSNDSTVNDSNCSKGKPSKSRECNVKKCYNAKETYKCSGDSIYWYDSDGNKSGIKEVCDYGCENKICKPKPYEEQVSYQCHGNSIYWYDSNGEKSGVKEVCDYGCDGNKCKEKYYTAWCQKQSGNSWLTSESPKGYLSTDFLCTHAVDNKQYQKGDIVDYEEGTITCLSFTEEERPNGILASDCEPEEIISSTNIREDIDVPYVFIDYYGNAIYLTSYPSGYGGGIYSFISLSWKDKSKMVI